VFHHFCLTRLQPLLQSQSVRPDQQFSILRRHLPAQTTRHQFAICNLQFAICNLNHTHAASLLRLSPPSTSSHRAAPRPTLNSASTRCRPACPMCRHSPESRFRVSIAAHHCSGVSARNPFTPCCTISTCTPTGLAT